MNKILIQLAVLCCALCIVNAFQSCGCEDYGSEAGCTELGGCFWQDNQCEVRQKNCSALTEDRCLAPGCLFLDNTCTDFKQCQQISAHQDSNFCKSYGCVLSQDDRTCDNFKNCLAITDPILCNGFTQRSKDVQDTVCYWHRLAEVCLNFKGCKGADLSVCKENPKMCVINGDQCDDLNCGDLKILDCSSNFPYCKLDDRDNTKCVSNDCKAFNSEQACHSNLNLNYCAWDGKGCKQCFAMSGKIYSMVSILFVLFVVTIL